MPAFAVLVFLVLDLLRVLRCSVSVTSHIWLTTFKLLGSTPVLLPGKSHGWRSLAGCSPWGLEESDTTERLHFHFSLLCTGEGNGNPLQYSCLENPRDGGTWWAAVYGVAQSRTRLKRLSSSSSSGKEPVCQCRKGKRCGLDPWVGKIPWRRAWNPTPVFLPGKSHGQRSLAGYSSWDRKELEMTEVI